jgi:hypothetical protein
MNETLNGKWSCRSFRHDPIEVKDGQIQGNPELATPWSLPFGVLEALKKKVQGDFVMKKRVLHWASLISLLLATTVSAQPSPENPGKVTQPLVLGNLVGDADRELHGLLTLSNPEGTCSASMLNDYWAITAAHCVFSNAGLCPQFAANQVTLRADWPIMKKTVNVRRIITYGTPTGCPLTTLGVPNDVAILQVGLYDLGRPDVRERKIDDRRPMGNYPVTAFGRGINALAAGSGATATPTVLDGAYRSVEFAFTGVTANEYAFFGGSGATVAGGDSGGPSLIQDWDDPNSTRRKLEWRLVGVHSRCQTTCLSGKSCTPANPWMWVASIPQCWDAAVLPVRSQIMAAIQEMPPNDSFIGTFGPIPTEVLAHKRALYAVSLDEPLMPPSNAAIDVPLTFKRCHNNLAQVLLGCPVTPVFEQWAYNSQTRQLLHTESGKCLNISGARTDAGSPIILYPCVGATNEKWSINSASSVWTITSDFTGMCLHARPGKVGRRVGSGPVVSLGTPATLVQMPCDESNAQRFVNVDSHWNERNGPR